MEILKNFIVGLFITMLAVIVLVLGFFLWPVLVGLGSLILSILIALVAVILAFYVIVFIGYVVRQGLKGAGENKNTSSCGAQTKEGLDTHE